MADASNLEVSYEDYKELRDSTVIHIRGLKLQLAVAHATLSAAKMGMRQTKKHGEKTPDEKAKEGHERANV